MRNLSAVLGWLLCLLIGISLACIPLTLQKIESFTQEQGTCTILKQKYAYDEVASAPLSDDDVAANQYRIELTYEVTTRDGHHAQATGYNGPRREDIPSEEEAKNTGQSHLNFESLKP